jgi:DNA-directed RNA polymerase specialized sigma24 family protein
MGSLARNALPTELVELGNLVIHHPKGLKRWSWYRCAYEEMQRSLGAGNMVDDAVAEISLAMMCGLDEEEALLEAAYRLQAQWRRHWDYRRPTMLSLDDAEVGCDLLVVPSAEDVALRELETEEEVQLLSALEPLSAREQQLILVYGETGNYAEAGRICGTKRQNVHAAVAKAQRLVEGRGTRAA